MAHTARRWALRLMHLRLCQLPAAGCELPSDGSVRTDRRVAVATCAAGRAWGISPRCPADSSGGSSSSDSASPAAWIRQPTASPRWLARTPFPEGECGLARRSLPQCPPPVRSRRGRWKGHRGSRPPPSRSHPKAQTAALPGGGRMIGQRVPAPCPVTRDRPASSDRATGAAVPEPPGRRPGAPPPPRGRLRGRPAPSRPPREFRQPNPR